jgi:hypothetical protein
MSSTALSVRIFPEILRTTAFGSITTSYVAVGSALLFPSRVINFQNTTDIPIFVSWDGVNDHMYIPSMSFILVDEGANKGGNADEFCAAKGTSFYIKYSGSAPTLGLFAITSFYGKV